MLVSGFAAISLWGAFGVEDQQKGLTSLASSVFRDTQEKPRFMQDGALSYLCFMFVRGFAAIYCWVEWAWRTTRMVYVAWQFRLS
jgi:hypothetical protein